MGFYARRVVPWLIHLAMRSTMLCPYRARLAAQARGTVLEIGIGSGLNLAHYGPAVAMVVGLDPAAPLLARAREAGSGRPFPLRLVQGSAMDLPFAAASVDMVLLSWTLRSIPDPRRALAEMRRVLRPGGRLLFVEHGRAPEPRIAAWQRRLTPAWRRVSGGCHLDRPMDALIAEAGFTLDAFATGYAPGPRLFTYFYEGAAGPAKR